MSIYGYYTNAAETSPTYDPGIAEVPCPICNKDLDAENVRTISLMVPDDNRSYFYRVHRTCHEPLDQQQRSAVDGLLIDAIYSARKVN